MAQTNIVQDKLEPVADTCEILGGGGGGGRNFQYVCLWCRFKICESFKYNAC